MGQHPTGVAEQRSEQAELAWRQFDLTPIDEDQMRLDVEEEIAELERGLFDECRQGGCVPHRDSHTRHQQIRPVRLGDVVVGTDVECSHHSPLVAIRRHHDDRTPLRLAHAATQLDSVEIGKPEIEHDQLRFLHR